MPSDFANFWHNRDKKSSKLTHICRVDRISFDIFVL